MTATTTGKPQASGLDSQYQRFAYIVTRGTGLDWRVVEAWMLAEGGPHDNPLNIGPGKHYGTVDAAATATIKLLRDPRYSAIRSSTRGSASQQIAAIAASPWDAAHYKGASSSPGALLRGTFARVKGAKPPTISGSHGQLFPGAKYFAGAADALNTDTGLANSEAGTSGGTLTHNVGGAGGWVGEIESFVVKESVVGLAYVGLVVAALAFIVIGSMRATGLTPPTARSRGGGGEDIPF